MLILDNHSAHKGQDRLDIMERFCKVEFTPTYSCELNEPIEGVWAVLKKRVLPKFTKMMIRKQFSREKCMEVVRREVKAIDSQTYANLLRIHWPYLQELLDKGMLMHTDPLAFAR